MKLIKVNGRYKFVNDNPENSKYLKYIERRKERTTDENYLDNIETAAITGRYIIDMIDGKCGNCDIEYSISENSLVWICPICDSVNINNRVKLKKIDIIFNNKHIIK